MPDTQILSIVCVLDPRPDDPIERVRDVHAAASLLEQPFELVIVINGPQRAAGVLRGLVAELEGLQLYFVKRRVDYLTATLAGVENAIGDWVATLDLACDDPRALRDMSMSVRRDGCEVVVAVPVERRRRGLVDRMLAGGFHVIFQRLHGFSLATGSPSARLMSRAVVNDVLQHDSPLIALETLTAAGGYARASVATLRRADLALPLAERFRTRWRTLIGINAAPLRLANLVCALGAIAAVFYSVYVIVIYLLKSDVVPGWTTVSLILSAMFLTMSLVLGMMSEYLIMLLDVGARRGRYEIIDELASAVQPRTRILNVETHA